MGKKTPKFYNNLPSRWLDYVPIGEVIENTRFIAFKVPLSRKYDKVIDPVNRFYVEDLIHYLYDNGKQLGMIIDLNFSNRYYNPGVLPRNIKYVKIMLNGRRLPPIDKVNRFRSEVDKFLKNNKHNNKLIGVHCTHGLNRTGYMICRYMIEVYGIDPERAIDMFSEARKHKIERPHYITDLMERKHLDFEIQIPSKENVKQDASSSDINVKNIPYVTVKTVKRFPACISVETVKEETPACISVETVKEETPACVKVETKSDKDELTVEISMMEHLILHH